MKYPRKTTNLPLILGAGGTVILNWWIDASFAVHPNMRGHTGGGLSKGREFPVVTSTKKKLKTRSSTETYIVGVYDCMPSVCWTWYFLEIQDYNFTENIVYQGNQIAILLENNGKASGSNITKHINIQFLFSTYRINKKEVTVEWCTKNGMTEYFMTKPLQGNLFNKFRYLIMGVIPTNK